jgi:hypothetical protein
MLRHVVMFTWNDDTPEGHAETVGQAFDGLSSSILTIRRLRHGADLGIVEGNADYALVADFDDEAGFSSYRHHSAHVDLVERLLSPYIARRTAVQFEIKE